MKRGLKVWKSLGYVKTHMGLCIGVPTSTTIMFDEKRPSPHKGKRLKP